DFIEGQSLSALIKQTGALSETRSVAIARQMAEALAFAHSEGIVHRDVKPANVMIVHAAGEQEAIKLVDFGLAYLQDTDIQRLTQTGSLLGSPSYMSPEQYNGKTADGRSDIYSLGCVLYEMLTGSVAFDGANAFDICAKHLSGDRQFVT